MTVQGLTLVFMKSLQHWHLSHGHLEGIQASCSKTGRNTLLTTAAPMHALLINSIVQTFDPPHVPSIMRYGLDTCTEIFSAVAQQGLERYAATGATEQDYTAVWPWVTLLRKLPSSCSSLVQHQSLGWRRFALGVSMFPHFQHCCCSKTCI